MSYKKTLAFAFLALLLAGFVPLNADTIALHPFKGYPEEIASDFYYILVRNLSRAPGGYTDYQIDLSRLPPDVPPGGFPAYICPSPSLTAGAPFAITGEARPDPDFDYEYRLRLYLWEMEGNTLLGSDEMTASDRASCEENMPSFLAWVLSWIDSYKEQLLGPQRIVEEVVVTEKEQLNKSRWLFLGRKDGAEGSIEDNPKKWVYLGPMDEKWLYMGIRAGGGTSQWYDNVSRDMSSVGWTQYPSTRFWGLGGGVHIALHLAAFFDVQVEANFNADFANVKDINTGELTGKFISYSMNFPLLLKLVLRGSQTKVGIFAGPYFYLPLSRSGQKFIPDYYDYKPDLPLGLVAGLNVGWQVGQGFLFVDGRFEYDGDWGKDSKGINYRNAIRLSIGYEAALIKKKR